MKIEVCKSDISVDGNPMYYVYAGDDTDYKEYHVLGDQYTSVSQRTPWYTNIPKSFAYNLTKARHQKIITKIDAWIAKANEIGFAPGVHTVNFEE